MLSSARVREPRDGWLVSFDCILSEAPETLQKCSVDTDAWKTVGTTEAQPGELVIWGGLGTVSWVLHLVRGDIEKDF